MTESVKVVQSAISPAPKGLPDPVERKDGVAYLPIDETAFVIPEKSWLKGYSRKATDGKVGTIMLHATVPEVDPWSQARHEEMYWPAGPGKKLLINIEAGQADAHLHFHEVPHSRMWRTKFIEEDSDQAAQGLRRFRAIWGEYTEEFVRETEKKFGLEIAEGLRKNTNKPRMSTVYYELIEQDRVKYLIDCTDGSDGLFHICHLSFPWGRTLMIDITFARDDIAHIVVMANTVTKRLQEFEVAGLARLISGSAKPAPVASKQ